MQALYGAAVTLHLSDIRALAADSLAQPGLLEESTSATGAGSSVLGDPGIGTNSVAAELAPSMQAPAASQDPAHQVTNTTTTTTTSSTWERPPGSGSGASLQASVVVQDVWWVVAHILSGRGSWGAASGEEVSHLAWAYARARVHHPPLMTALARHAARLCPPPSAHTGGVVGPDTATAVARMTPRERRLFYRQRRESAAAAREQARAASNALVAVEDNAGSSGSLVSAQGQGRSHQPPALLTDMRAAGGEKLVDTVRAPWAVAHVVG